MPKLAFWTVLCLILLFSACDTGTMIYTQNELSDMYGITVTSDALALEERSFTSPEDPFIVTLEIDVNAPQPASVQIELFDSLNESIASVLFVKKAESSEGIENNEAAPDDEASIQVAILDGELPPIQFPENLADGYYRLVTSILDTNERKLASSSLPLLIYKAAAPELRITLHPAAIHTGRKALIKAGFNGVVSDQAWIRWLVNGTLWQEGSVSARMDRIVWDTPDNQGIHTVQAEYYPFEPPADIKVLPYATRSIKIPVSKLENSELETDSRLYGTVSLDSAEAEFSSLSNQLKAETTSFGTLYPEASSRGFGHAMEENGGLYSSIDFLPPVAAAKDFSLRFALEPLPAYGQYLPNGNIYRLQDDNDREIFILGVHSGHLYVKTETEAESLLPLPDQALLIILNARSVDGWLQITVHVNKLLFVSTTIPEFRSLSRGYRHNLAGVGGFPAIYEEAQSFTGIISPYIATEQHWGGDSLLAVKDFDFERLAGEAGIGQLIARTEAGTEPEDTLPAAAAEVAITSNNHVQLMQIPLGKSNLQKGVSLELNFSGSEPYFELRLDETVRLLFDADRKLSAVIKTAQPETAEQVVNLELPFDAISDNQFKLGLRLKNDILQLYQAGHPDSLNIPQTSNLVPAQLSLHMHTESGPDETEGWIATIPHTLRAQTD